MFSFWFDLPPVLRAGLGILMMIIAGTIWYLSGGRTFAIGCGVVGLLFVLFSNAGNSDGYNF